MFDKAIAAANLVGQTLDRVSVQALLTDGFDSLVRELTSSLNHPGFCRQILDSSPSARPGYRSFVLFNRETLRIRINVWQPSYIEFLRSTPTVHSHNWDMSSRPLIGGLKNSIFQRLPSDSGKYALFEERDGAGSQALSFIERVECEPIAHEIIQSDEVYTVSKGQLHAVIPALPATATFCVQYNLTRSCRFLCLRDDVDTSPFTPDRTLGAPDISDLLHLLQTKVVRDRPQSSAREHR